MISQFFFIFAIVISPQDMQSEMLKMDYYVFFLHKYVCM